MATKTYQIGLLFGLQQIYKYITRWQLKLQAVLSGPQYTCLLAVLDAVTACLTALGQRPVE